MLAAVTQSRWDYVNVRGFGVLTVAPALWLPGGYALPWGSRRGTNQQESVAGLSGHSLLTLFPLLREARRGTAASLSLERREPERESLAVELP